MRKYLFLALFYLFFVQFSGFGQTHLALPLEDPVYHIIETAQMRGLIGFLPVVKPYSRAKVIELIDEILAASISEAERDIILRHRSRLSPQRGGVNLTRGTLSGENVWNDIYFSYEFGVGMDFVYSGAYYQNAGGYKYNKDSDDSIFTGADHVSKGELINAFDIGIPSLSFLGDLGKNNSYGLTLTGRIVNNPRVILGRGYNHYEYYDETDPRQVAVYGEPLAYFPYTYKKRWDGFVWPIKQVSTGSMMNWPNNFGIGYTMIPELSGAFLGGAVNYRIARLDREWTGMAQGSSLTLNRTAQPFLAAEITITPFEWISISSMTGIMEYHDSTGESNGWGGQSAAKTQQNAYSMVMLELNYKKYFHLDFGTNVLWPKRFEIGYIFPFADNLLYQNNIGDFDNIAIFIDIMGQYPGLGKVWFSFFLDEMDISEDDLFAKDRSMYAFQIGAGVIIPWLPFASLTFSYTKIEPYNYTHQRVDTMPWYNGLWMETNYVNAGRALGHYLPPNSDEFLLRFDTMPFSQARFSLQYQLIRHGADYGDRAVDGSSLWSELDPDNRGRLYKYFLRDGAYEWMHIIKLRGEYSLVDYKWPVKLFMEVGGVYSYFTDIDGPVNDNTGARPYKTVNTPQYPHKLYFIATLGIVLFPK